MKVPVVAPAATVTDAGTVSPAVLLDSETAAPPAGAACDNVTVQLDVALLPKLVGVQTKELTVVGAIRDRVAVLEAPLYVAVTVADWLLVIEAAVAVNVVLVAPAATVTDAGTLNAPLLLESATAAPPLGAPCVSETVQVDVPAEFTVVGLQLRLLMFTGLRTATLPPLPLTVRAVPLGEAPSVFVSPIGTVPVAAPDSVTLTTATVPFWMMVEFDPTSRHV